MAEIFSGERIVPVWLSAVRKLNCAPRRTAFNYILEITSPTALAADDLAVREAVDAKLRAFTDDMTLNTVAGTLFPNDMYLRHGRPAFYARYLTAIKRGKKKRTWGTYAWRMMERTDPKSGRNFNPLDRIVEKFAFAARKQAYRAGYELGVLEPDDVLAEDAGGPWCELPIADSAGKAWRNIPCLSHLSFKLNDGQVALTAVYRSHYYAQRALGNLIGLSQVQSFVAKEAGLPVGPLTCVSTLAVLDTDKWGGVQATTDFLGSLSVS